MTDNQCLVLMHPVPPIITEVQPLRLRLVRPLLPPGHDNEHHDEGQVDHKADNKC